MHYKFFAHSDPGKVRQNNEDSVSFDEACRVVVLADGMGGYKAGEVASAMATSLIQSELVRWLSSGDLSPSSSQLMRAIDICTTRANEAILNKAMTDPDCFGMGTTLVVGVFQPSSLVLGHIGDSRCYCWRHGSLRQLTRDHSMLQEQVDAGVLTMEQAARAPGKNLLTRALGIKEAMPIDIQEVAVQAGDLYLLCSDGLTEMLSDGDIAQILGMDASLERLARTLVAQANALGGRDNVTVLLARAYSRSERPNLVSKLFGATLSHATDAK